MLSKHMVQHLREILFSFVKELILIGQVWSREWKLAKFQGVNADSWIFWLSISNLVMSDSKKWMTLDLVQGSNWG